MASLGSKAVAGNARPLPSRADVDLEVVDVPRRLRRRGLDAVVSAAGGGLQPVLAEWGALTNGGQRRQGRPRRASSRSSAGCARRGVGPAGVLAGRRTGRARRRARTRRGGRRGLRSRHSRGRFRNVRTLRARTCTRSPLPGLGRCGQHNVVAAACPLIFKTLVTCEVRARNYP